MGGVDATTGAIQRGIAVRLRAIARQVVDQRVGRAIDQQGRLRLASRDALSGILPAEYGGTGGASVPVPPPYAHLVDGDGAYLTDGDGAYLFEYL